MPSSKEPVVSADVQMSCAYVNFSFGKWFFLRFPVPACVLAHAALSWVFLGGSSSYLGSFRLEKPSENMGFTMPQHC